MSFRYSATLFLISFGIFAFSAKFQSSPGYMDADYYQSVGISLANGDGFSSPTIWNYLDDPESLPHPAHSYWMPLASLLSGIGMRIFPGLETFEAAQWVFILIASLVPVFTAHLSFRLWEREDVGKLAGALALFPGFYATFLTTSDTFGIYMLLGTAFFLSMLRAVRQPGTFGWMGIGIVGGLMHLARADGVVWIFASGAYLVYQSIAKKDSEQSRSLEKEDENPPLDGLVLQSIFFMVIGYGIVMAPWFWRNLNEFGVPLNPGGMKTLWMRNYDDLFLYPSSGINFGSWQQSGFSAIVIDRIQALWQNIQSAIAVQGSIFLAPLMIVGWWKSRKREIVKAAVFVWLLTLFLMTIVFPYSGSRGGFFHAGAGLQPIGWGFAAVGFYEFIDWGWRRRGWEKKQAGAIFKASAITFAAVLTAVLVFQKFQGKEKGFQGWNQYASRYAQIENVLMKEDPQKEGVVMVINPPGYFLSSGRPAIAIPSNGEEAMNAAARDFGAMFLIVEYDHPVELEEYHSNAGNIGWWEYLATINGAVIYRSSPAGYP